MQLRKLIISSFCLIWLSACGAKTNETTIPARENFGARISNITDGAVADYNPNIDYFPEKTKIRYSRQLKVEYHNNYKLVTVNPRGNPDYQQRYLLVQRGTPRPAGFDGVRTLGVPVRNFALMNWQHALMVEILGLHDKLLGVDDFNSYSTPGIVELIQEKKSSIPITALAKRTRKR